jgi:methionine aminotransferase
MQHSNLPLGSVRSRLPHVKGSIFSALSRVAKQYDAINLSQGFPDFAPDPRLLESLSIATKGGHNQYGMPEGSEALRRSIGHMYEDLYSLRISPDAEITITAGATQAISAAVSSLVHPGEEVIFLAPAFESYAPSILMAGATPVCVDLPAPRFEIDWEEVERRVSPHTRMIIVNSPHNPSGRCWNSNDVDRLATLAQRHNLLVLSDEVYHNMVFDGPHITALSEPRLRERTIVVGSLGKTMHVTGWRIGYAAAAAPLTAELRKILQFTTYAAPTPLQQAMADVLDASTYLSLPALFRGKRDRFLAGLRGSRFEFVPTSGGYFQLLDYSAISAVPDTQFADLLISEHGVAGLPVSGFGAQYANSRLLRFCFAKSDETIDKATHLLRAL